MSGLVCAAPVGDVCGEGAVWEAAAGRLWWTDINRFLVHSLTVADGSVRTWMFAEPAVAVALTDRPGVVLVALASRLILLTPETDAREPLGPVLPGWPAVRFNDGRPGPDGRLVIGTMGNNVGPDGEGLPVAPGLGRLYRFGGGALEELRSGIGIANTVCWSPDLGTFYFADTMANALNAYGYDAATGAVGAGRGFLVDFPRGHPDGSAVDSAGHLWNCRYGGGCVVRVAPDGQVERVVEVPCRNVTTCTFGGAGLRTLYITTARAGDEARLAGSVFALEAPVPGLPERVFRL